MNLSHENGHAKRFSFSMFIVFCLFLEKILQHLGSLWTTKNLGEGLSQMIHPLKAYFAHLFLLRPKSMTVLRETFVNSPAVRIFSQHNFQSAHVGQVGLCTYQPKVPFKRKTNPDRCRSHSAQFCSPFTAWLSKRVQNRKKAKTKDFL